MRDIVDKITALLLIASAGLVFSDILFPAAILAWITTFLTCLSVAFAPSWASNMHWRVLFLYIMSVTASTVIPVSLFSNQYVDGDGIVALACLMIVSALLALLLLSVFPKPSPSRLLGPYKLVGTTSFVLHLDKNFMDKEENKHKILDKVNDSLPVQVWFPMQSHSNPILNIIERFCSLRAILWTSGCPKEEYAESVLLLDNIAKNYGLPSAITRHLSLARTNSLWQNNLDRLLVVQQATELGGAGKKENCHFPIAIYSHGMYGWRTLHTSLCESLASLGFIVLACDHAPDCMVSRPIHEVNDKHVAFDFHVPDSNDDQVGRQFYSSGLQRRVRDMTEMLDHIVSGAFERRYPILQHRLNYDHICMWGHSFGGGTICGTICQENVPTVARVAALDSWMYPIPDDLRRKGKKQGTELLSISSNLWEFGKYQVPFRRSLEPTFDLIYDGTDHQNYCETYLIASAALLRRPNVLGRSVDPQQVIRHVDSLVAGFFLSSHVSCNKNDGATDARSGKLAIPLRDTKVHAEETGDAIVISDAENQVGLLSITDTVSNDTDSHELPVKPNGDKEQSSDPTLQALLNYCSVSSTKTITGTSVNLSHKDKEAMKRGIRHESSFPEFCDSSYFDRIESQRPVTTIT